MDQEFTISDELRDLHDKYVAYTKVRDIYVKIPFSYKKAVKAAIDAEKTKSIFWGKFFKLYPGTTGKNFEYNHNKGIVEVK
jgi:hypothetical protein